MVPRKILHIKEHSRQFGMLKKIKTGVPQHEYVDSVMNRDHDVHSLQSILETLEQTALHLHRY